MAELIDKGALYDAMTEEYKKHYAGDVSASGFTIAMQMVQSQPTTTESEIRAKAISDFQKEIRDWQIDIQDNEHDSDKYDFVFERIYEIAEQLKGGMRNDGA